MKPVPLVLTVTLAIASLSLVAWLGRSQATAPQANSAQPKTENELPMPTSGPFGKAVAGETQFDFGSVERGDTGSHTFTIKNEGQGPLRLRKGRTSCEQCTFGTLSKENEDIAPGETVELTINWKISQHGGRFRQTADVYTNDPEHKKLVFGIQGMIEEPLSMIPAGTLAIGNLSETGPTTVTAHLFSNLVDEITITKVECDNPLVTVTSEKAPEEDLVRKPAKAGLILTVSVAPGSSIGPMREKVKLHTNVRDGSTVEFDVIGRRPGPIEVLGKGWNPSNNSANLGEFPCTAGAKVTLKMYVRNMEEELVATREPAEGTHALVTVAPTGTTIGASKIYDLTVEVPPGPAGVHHAKEAEPVILKVNHPTIKEFKMYVDYHAK